MVYSLAVICITEEEVPYTDTMVLAMHMARSPGVHPSEDSLLDLETSIHEQPLSKLGSLVCDELNASRRFEELLSTELGGNSSATDGDAPLEPRKMALESTSSDSLDEFMAKETQENRAFEEYLHLALLDET